MLNLITYPEKTTNLVVVHVNGNALPGNMSSTEFKNQLDEIYGVAGMKWNLLPEINIPNFDYAGADQIGTFNAWPTGGSPYTLDMNELIAEIHTSGNHDPNNYYLFLLNNSEISGQLGIMPFSQQYAFVFADKFNQDGRFIKTSAHELAHGIFNLEHQYKFHAGIDTFATANLMTYHPTATNLNKYQWDRVQNPLDRGYHDAGDEGHTDGIKDVLTFIRDLRLSKKYNLTIKNQFVYQSLNSWRTVYGTRFFNKNIGKFLIGSREKTATTIIVQSIEKDYKSEAANKYQIIVKSNNFNFFLAFVKENDRDNIYDYINGGNNMFYTNSLILNNKEYSFTKIYNGIENIRQRLIISGDYYNMSLTDKTILDIPIIQWGIGWYYGSIFYYNWLTENGEIVADIEIQNWLKQWNVFKVRLNNYNTFINNEVLNEKIIKVKIEEFDCQNCANFSTIFSDGPKTTLYSLNDLKNSSFEDEDLIVWNANRDITNFSTTTISGIEDSKNLNGWVGAFAGMSLKHYFNGEVLKNNSNSLEIKVDKIVLMIVDGFDFINDDDNDQPLGNWDNNIFSPIKPKLGFDISNDDIANFHETYNIGLDFTITLTFNYNLLFNKIIYSKQENSIIFKNE